MKNYDSEARSRWGSTDAYREHEQKTKDYTKENWTEANEGLMAIFAEFAAVKNSGTSADSAEAQALVAGLQAYITENYYTCTGEILAGLGKMYACDGRFKNYKESPGVFSIWQWKIGEKRGSHPCICSPTTRDFMSAAAGSSCAWLRARVNKKSQECTSTNNNLYKEN